MTNAAYPCSRRLRIRFQNPLDDPRRAPAVYQWRQRHTPAAGFDDVPADDLLFFVVGPFDQHIGLHGLDQLDWRVLIEPHEIVDTLQSFQHADAILFRNDRPLLAFEPADAGVGVHADDEQVALLS